MPKIICDVDRANAELQTIYERHEALGCHLWGGIKAGIADHNKHELAHGFTMATPAEIKRALAATVLNVLGPIDLEDFIDLLRMADTMEFFECL